VPEGFVRVDEDEGTSRRRARDPEPRAGARGGTDVPADVVAELASAAGSDWGVLRARVTERMGAALAAFERERYRDALRMLRPVVDAVPSAPTPRELLGLCHYRIGNWRAALHQLDAFAALSGSSDQDPARMDCHRALGHHSRVRSLWDELRRSSPDADVLAEGRLVLAGATADRGALGEAVRILADAGAGRLVRRPADRHVRQWYALADLLERSGDIVTARTLFARVAAVDPDAYDVSSRLEALGGPPTRPGRPKHPTSGPKPSKGGGGTR
jgi:tetratricopeptide (TPR) repeat protein